MSLKIFDYCCSNGHVFEVWLREPADAAPSVCPECGAPAERRLPSAPGLKPVEGTTRTEVEGDVALRRAAEAQRATEAAYVALMRRAVEKAEDVGKSFPDAVRAMERGSEKRRLVRGECTPLAAAELRADGIDVLPIPDEALKPLN